MTGLAILLAAATLTAGWENVCATRAWPEVTNRIWQADFADGADGFAVERRDGAEGDVEFLADGIRIRKTNGKGYLLVVSRRTFDAPPKTRIQAVADTCEVSGDPTRALGMLRLWSGEENLAYWGGSANPPSPTLEFLENTPPGGHVRKFATYAPKDGSWDYKTDLTKPVSAAIVVAGAPSVSTWRNWHVRDWTEAAANWRRANERARAGTRDHSGEVVDEATFAAGLAADVEHTAKVVKTNGFAQLLVDGRPTLPVVYKGVGSRRLFCGRRMEEKADLRFQEAVIGLGRRLDQPNGPYFWTPQGFDAKGAVEELRKQMRASPKSVFLVGLSVNPYPEFAEEHPDEVWIDKDGKPQYGRDCHLAFEGFDSASKDPKAWKWISMMSPVWREGAKKCLGELIAELKRTGLSKRVVGFHLSGFHDGQFAPALYDWSKPAKAGYRAFLERKHGRPFPAAEPPDFKRYGSYGSGKDFIFDAADAELVDFQEYMHKAPFEAQDELAQEVKRCFGKDVIVVKWCMSAFGGSKQSELDFAEFLGAKGIDVLVAQAAYARRPPARAIPEWRVPASFHEHGKVYMAELDYPTWLRGYGLDEIDADYRGYIRDFPMWEAANRKIAGQLFALRHGFWYYDMSGAAYDDDRQLEDIRTTNLVGAELIRRKVDPWTAPAAFVIDEAGLFRRNISGRGTLVDENQMFSTQVARLVTSGVQTDVWLADDFIRNPALGKKYRVIVFAGMYAVDSARERMVRELSSDGRTLVFASGTGTCGGAERLGFRMDVTPRYARHEIVPAPGYADDEVKGYFETAAQRVSVGVTNRSLFCWNVQRPLRFSLAADPGADVLARYAEDGAVAIAAKKVGDARHVVVCDQIGLTAPLMNRLAREAGAYVSGRAGVVQTDMNGNFVSIHALQAGHYDFRLPFAARVTNLRSGRVEKTDGLVLPLELAAGGTYWFRLSRLYDVRDFGAKGDGTTLDTAAIQRALDACGRTGGTVRLADGTFKTGTVWLRDDTEFLIEKGATLLGSDDLDDYNAPDAFAQNYNYAPEGWSAKHLVLAVEVKNVSIAGGGTIDGNARAYFDDKPAYVGKVGWRRGAIRAKDAKNCGRPGQEIEFVECENVSVRDVTLRDMCCWSCFFYGTDHVRVGNVTVRNDLRHLNTDAFDIDSCRDVKVGDCDIVTGDDAFAVRGSPAHLKNQGRICEDVEISNCVCQVSACGVRVGVGTGVVHRVSVRNLKINEAGRALHVQSSYLAGSRGVDISEVSFADVEVRNAGAVVSVTGGTKGSKAKIEDISFENVRGESLFAPSVTGAGETRPTRIVFRNCDFTVTTPDAPGFTVDKADAVNFYDTRVRNAR